MKQLDNGADCQLCDGNRRKRVLIEWCHIQALCHRRHMRILRRRLQLGSSCHRPDRQTSRLALLLLVKLRTVIQFVATLTGEVDEHDIVRTFLYSRDKTLSVDQDCNIDKARSSHTPGNDRCGHHAFIESGDAHRDRSCCSAA
jgi:hypothetical protein